MSFLNPWGLLGLIGIPILILIYILRPRFEEKVVTSTFIWKLSLKYKKKNVPLQWLRRSLLFLLQVMIIVTVSLLLARPVIQTDDAKQQVVIIDASASMMVESDGESRFSRAISELEKQIKKLSDGSSMTIIYVTNDADVVAEEESSKRTLNNVVEGLECSYEEGNMEAAITIADSILSSNSMAELTIYSDQDYTIAGGEDRVTQVNVSADEWNAAVTAFSASESTKNTYTFTSDIVSYGKDDTLTVALYVDDEYVDSQIVEASADTVQELEWDTDLIEYAKAQIYIEADDNFESDNEYYIYNDESTTYQVLLASSTPTFLKSILSVVGNFDVTVVSSLDDTELTGYDLYIFDGIIPDTMPDNGAVWIFSPTSSPSGMNLQIGSTITGSFYLENGISGSSSTSSQNKTDVVGCLTDTIDSENIALSEYTELTSQDDLETVFLCDNKSVVLAGEINNMRTVVFGFDIHDSNLPLLIEFPQLIYNMISYSLPQMLEETVYNVGDTAEIQSVSSSQLITVSGAETAEYYNFPASYEIEAPGIYWISQTLEDGSSVSGEFFAHVSTSESNISTDGQKLTITAETTEDDAEDHTYQKELWIYLAILLLLLIIAEWEVQYHEQI